MHTLALSYSFFLSRSFSYNINFIVTGTVSIHPTACHTAEGVPQALLGFSPRILYVYIYVCVCLFVFLFFCI
jgi:hypothetical protein